MLPIALLVLARVGHAQPDTDPLSIVFPVTGYENIDRANFPEPSGICYHPTRNTLYLVGDGGDVAELSTDGTILKQTTLGGRDFEGITVDPATGLVYVAVEGEDRIIEIDPLMLEITREFPIDRTLDGKTLLAEGGQGIEGLAFLADEAHPEGGTFLVANQAFTIGEAEDMSAVFEVVAPIRTGPEAGEAPAKIARALDLGVPDLSGLFYDADRDRLYVISDSKNLFMEATTDGQVLAAYAFPGANQEGIALDPEGYIYIAQDSGGILKHKWAREPE